MNEKEKLLVIINDIREDKDLVAIESIKDEMSLRHDLELKSLDLATLTVMLEEEFDIDIFSDGVVSTIGEVLVKLRA
tara:strand:+ start:9078 stop:9308 length:231 start_codon:yes stop_codon:yes gene_type:complete